MSSAQVSQFLWEKAGAGESPTRLARDGHAWDGGDPPQPRLSRIKEGWRRWELRPGKERAAGCL